MIPTRFYLDSRKTKPGYPATLKFVITKNRSRALIPLNIRIPAEDWDPDDQKAKGNSRNLNLLLHETFTSYNSILIRWENEGLLQSKTATEIKRMLEDYLKGQETKECTPQYGPFLGRFIDFRDRHKGRTYEVYDHTLKRIKAYIGEKALNKLTFEDITLNWLRDFNAFLSQTSRSANGRNIHFRNIRAVFNDALDDELISCYPFRKFKIRNEATRKRSMEIDELRKIFSMDVLPHEEIYRDMFKLIFMLIGINTKDLYNLKEINDRGRIEYKRSKTGKLYSIKVEPEAMEIIEKWKGRTGLLKIADRWIDDISFRKYLNKALRLIGAQRSGLGGKKGKGLFPEISSYWARHSWATMAAELDIPDAVISQALGHSAENRVTDIYIKRNPRKVDEANRKVLDWILYDKR